MSSGFQKTYGLKNGRMLTVRSLLPDDAPKMIAFMNAVDTETRFLSREPGEFNYTEEQEREIITRRGADEDTYWLVGEIDGAIAANCEARRVGARSRFRHRASMGIVVGREYWRLGIGKILIQELIAWCREKGFEQLELEVLAANERAQALYRSVGFTVTGTRPNAFKYPDGTYADDLFMVKPLK